MQSKKLPYFPPRYQTHGWRSILPSLCIDKFMCVQMHFLKLNGHYGRWQRSCHHNTQFCLLRCLVASSGQDLIYATSVYGVIRLQSCDIAKANTKNWSLPNMPIWQDVTHVFCLWPLLHVSLPQFARKILLQKVGKTWNNKGDPRNWGAAVWAAARQLLNSDDGYKRQMCFVFSWVAPCQNKCLVSKDWLDHIEEILMNSRQGWLSCLCH